MSTNNKQQNYFEDSITLYMNSFLCKGGNSFNKKDIEKAFDGVPNEYSFWHPDGRYEIIRQRPAIPHEHIFWYPDGTLQIFGECFKKSFESSSFVRDIRNEGFQFIKNYKTRSGGPDFSHWAGSLIPFMRYGIAIWVWEHDPKLFRNLNGKIFFAPCVTTLEDNQCPLDNTTVHLVFKKTIRSKQIDSFIEVIKNWLSSEMNQTDNNRNKVNLNNKGLIEFFQKITRFSIDITNADQNIITYLMLHLSAFHRLILLKEYILLNLIKQ
jgi:hypothetical protein